MLRAVAGAPADTGAITIGTPVTGGSANTVLYVDSGLLLQNASTLPFSVTVQGLTTTSPGWYAQLTGDTTPRIRVGLNSTDVASLGFGPGNAVRDLFLERAGAANLRFGAPDAAVPVGQTLSIQNVLTGTTDTAGANFTVDASQGTGTGAGGQFIIRTAPAGSTGSTQNALATRLAVGTTASLRLGTNTANTTEIYNSANAQTWRLFGSRTDGSNGDWIEASKAAGGAAYIRTVANGTGTASTLNLGTGGTNYWTVGTSGGLTAVTDNSYDIGASGAIRPRTLYLGTSAIIGTPTSTSAALSAARNGATMFIGEGTAASGPSGGAVFILYSNDGSALASGDRLGGFFAGGNGGGGNVSSAALVGFANQNWSNGTAYGSRLEFQTTANTTTSITTKLILGNSGILTFGATEANTVPALKPSSTVLQARLGDDSAFTDMAVLNILINNASALVTSSVAMNDGAAAAAGTLLNAPIAGNPTKWIPINDNGTTRYIPAW